MKPLAFSSIQPSTVLWILFCISFIMSPCPVSGQENESAAENLKVLKFAAAFEALPGIEIKDAQLAFQRIIRKTMIKESDPYDAKLEFLTNWDKAEEALSIGGYHFVILTGLDYASLNRSVPLRPVIILSRLEQPTESLMLITRKGASLADLGPKPKLIMEEGRIGDFSRIWLDTVLVQSGVNDSQGLFSEIDYARKPSRIILPVFFGKADACVVTRSAFELMSELNPQIPKVLSMQRQSDGYIFWLICATDLATPKDIAIIDNDATTWVAEAAEDYAVGQALTLVQMKKFFSFKKEYMQATLDLFERYRQLTRQQHDVTPRDLKKGDMSK